MSTNIINSRKPELVALGSFTLCCESFKAEASLAVADEVTVSGDEVITSAAPKYTRITLTGRVCDENSPLAAVITINNMLRSRTAMSVTYRGVVFSSCRLLSYKITDSGEDFLDITATLVTVEPVTAEGGSS